MDTESTERSFQVSIITRKNIFDELLILDQYRNNPISGRLDLVDFLKRIWPLDDMPSTDPRFQTAEADIWQHMVNNWDWNYEYLFDEYLGLLKGDDKQFLRFLEELVHPLVREPEKQERYVSVINKHLLRDGYKLQAVEQISGYPLFRTMRMNSGVGKKVKNLIFAANGLKPEIVLDDSISNDIKIVKYEENCLVYDLPIPQTGLLWIDLVAWWAKNTNSSPTLETERHLYRRLEQSLDSEPEKLLFDTYYRIFREALGERLPALIPQVYLHYDPYTMRKLKGELRLSRQRMDFLLLFSNHERIVLEVDGKHHYADGEKAKPQKYAEMVEADRKLKLAGYEVYRFGGYELYKEHGKAAVQEFFQALLQKYHIARREDFVDWQT